MVLSIRLKSGGASLSWGEVLGVREYRLYAGDKLVHQGPERQFTDAHAAQSYTVSAVNGNGEGARSNAVQSDPASWLTFDPKPGEPFRRDAVTPLHYPR